YYSGFGAHSQAVAPRTATSTTRPTTTTTTRTTTTKGRFGSCNRMQFGGMFSMAPSFDTLVDALASGRELKVLPAGLRRAHSLFCDKVKLNPTAWQGQWYVPVNCEDYDHPESSGDGNVICGSYWEAEMFAILWGGYQPELPPTTSSATTTTTTTTQAPTQSAGWWSGFQQFGWMTSGSTQASASEKLAPPKPLPTGTAPPPPRPHTRYPSCTAAQPEFAVAAEMDEIMDLAMDPGRIMKLTPFGFPDAVSLSCDGVEGQPTEWEGSGKWQIRTK
ncbi:hypothetical protein FOZ63_010896, partial [Perkinsus olseni]